MTFQAWLQQAIARLAESDSPRRDAEILLGHVTGRARTWILAFGETTLSADEAARLEALLVRRQRGEPIAHLVGRCRCWSATPATQALARLPCRILASAPGRSGSRARAAAVRLPGDADPRPATVTAVEQALALASANRAVPYSRPRHRDRRHCPGAGQRTSGL